MKTYIVKVRTVGQEVWVVDAESPEQAREDYWENGMCVNSEVLDSEINDIEEESD